MARSLLRPEMISRSVSSQETASIRNASFFTEATEPANNTVYEGNITGSITISLQTNEVIRPDLFSTVKKSSYIHVLSGCNE